MRLVGRFLVGAIFLIWLALEVWFSVDKNPETWPMTREIVYLLPYPITAAIIAWFIKWAPRHFDHAYRKEGTMKGFKFEPVKWMTIILGVLVALSSVPLFMDWLPDRVQAVILIAIAVLTAILGKTVHDRVTPLAAPKDDAGTPLVPANVTIKPRGPMRPMGG